MTGLHEEAGMPALKVQLLLILVILVAALIPLVLYEATLGRTPTVLPGRAHQLLNEDPAAVLVDVRTVGEYQARHIDNATNWPLSQVLSIKSPRELPVAFQQRTLFLVCNAGIGSYAATTHLKNLGIANAYSVRGGIQEWVAEAANARSGGCVLGSWRTAAGKVESSPYRASPLLEQVITVVSGFGVKPAYTLLSLLLVIVLWRSKALDLASLRWAMVFFFIGENFCALNYGLYNDGSYLFEYLHSLGMLLCFSFATFAFVEGFDRRILLLSDPARRCAALSLCGICVKHADVPCGLKRIFYLVLPALFIIAAMPLLAPYQLNSYNTSIFGTFYNYSHPFVHQVFESRCCPITAMVLLATSFMALITRREQSLLAAKILFAAALGYFGFGFFRTVLLGLYSQNMLWFVIWEEITEFLFVLAIAFILWTFRQRLFTASSGS